MKKKLVLNMLFAALPMYAANNYLAVPHLETDRRPSISVSFSDRRPSVSLSRAEDANVTPRTPISPRIPSVTKFSIVSSLTEPIGKCRSNNRASITLSSFDLPTERIERSQIEPRPFSSTQELIAFMNEEGMKIKKSNQDSRMSAHLTVSADDISSEETIRNAQTSENANYDPLYDAVEYYFTTHKKLPTHITAIDFEDDDIYYFGSLIPHHTAPRNMWHVKIAAKGYDNDQPQYFACIRNTHTNTLSITPISEPYFNLYDDLYEVMHLPPSQRDGNVSQSVDKKRLSLSRNARKATSTQKKEKKPICSCIII